MFKGACFINDKGCLRYITALEAERLFGFPDGYTSIENADDWKRIGALGNSMAVSVMCWIGERINRMEGPMRIGSQVQAAE